MKKLPSIANLPKNLYNVEIKRTKKIMMADAIISEEKQYIDKNYVPLPKTKSKSPGKKIQSITRYTQKSNKRNWNKDARRNRSDAEDNLEPMNLELENNLQSVQDEGSIDTAINHGANFFSNRNLA
jgi:hypothetical protein